MLIGDVSRRSGVSIRMLRHYESIGLVVPSGRTAGGYRRYSEQDLLTRLQRIKHTGPEEWDEVLRIVALLRALGSEHPGRRQRAALQIPSETPTAGLLIEALLDEDDPNVAGALRWALARSGPETEEGLDRLAAALRSPDVQTRRRAVGAAAEAGGARITALLRGLLSDPDDMVRTRAALTLARRGDQTAAPVLIEMIVTGLSDVEAAETLAGLALEEDGGAEVVAALSARVESAVPAVRRRVAQALADFPYESARTVLDVLARDPDRAVSLTARAVIATAEARRDPGASAGTMGR
jgi:HEAT repeat protein